MSTTTTNFGWTVPSDTDLVKDGAAAIRTALGGVDTSFVDLKGGTTGQVLAKASGTDLDFSWVAQDDSNAIQNAIVDAKGDLIAATAADTPARLAVGSNGQVLTADSTASTGLAWTTPSSGAGLTLIAAQAFSGSSAQSINSCFSSTYTNYRIILQISSTSATGYIYVRLRASGTDDSSSNYNMASIYFSNAGGGVGYDNLVNTTAFQGTYNETTAKNNVSFYDFYNPQATELTGMITHANRYAVSGASAATYVGGGQLNVTTSFDGFTLYPGSGTMTGKVWVYGYSN